MKRFYYYIFFKLAKYYKKEWHEKYNYPVAIVVFTAIILGHIFALTNFASILFRMTHISHYILTGNRAVDRFIIIPLVVAPFFIAIILWYRKNKNTIGDYFKEFEILQNDERRKMDKYYKIYVSLTIILAFLSIFSSALVG